MTRQQQTFIHEYLVDLNGRQAAIRSGYAIDSAERAAWKLLQDPKIKAIIDEQMAARLERCSINADWVLSRLKHEATYYGEDASHGARVAALATLTKCLSMLRQEPTPQQKVEFVFNLSGKQQPVIEHTP